MKFIIKNGLVLITFCILIFLGLAYYRNRVFTSSLPSVQKVNLDTAPLKTLFTDEKFIKRALDDWGVAHLAQVLKRRQAPGFSCHLALHKAAHLIYHEYGIEGMSKCPMDICDSACHHGIIESAAEVEKGMDDMALIKLACEHPQSGVSMYACTHGLGHGFMFLHELDLDKSLASCEKLMSYKESCRGGVYMQYVFTNEIKLKKSLTQNPGYGYAICSQSSSEHSSSCYHYMTAFMREAANMDFESMQSQCDNLPADHRQICVQEYAKLRAKYDPSLIEQNFCNNKYTSTARDACDIGMKVANIKDVKTQKAESLSCASYPSRLRSQCEDAFDQLSHELELKK